MDVPVGTIFENRTSFWKVTGPKYASYGSRSKPNTYPVVKCTKYGKEFSATNGFSDTLVEHLYAKGATTAATYKAGEGVSEAGKESGIRKRRILWLEATIKAYTKELEELNTQENA